MKRFLSAILSMAMVLSLCTFLGVTSVAAITEISNTSPAITANVGDTVDLSGYSVVFDGDTAATASVTWTNEAGAAISRMKITEKGVVPVTAKSGSKTKTIYIVSKEVNETEYVLYEADFSEYSSISQLKAEGWKFLNSDNRYAISNGTFVLGNTGDGYARAILPEWLGDFGDYGISTDLKMLSTIDTGRWVGVVYRIQNTNSKYYPYYHMCVREATTASGIEFAERTAGDGWNVVMKASGDITSLKNAYNNFTINAKGSKISYSINGSQVMYITEDLISKTVTGVSAAKYDKGMLGLTMNYGTVAFKNIKVTVQETEPVKAAKKLDLINNSREDINLINPIANVEAVNSIEALEATEAGSVFAYCDENFNYSGFVKSCVENQKLATYYVENTNQADLLISALKANGCKDANVISYDSKVLSHIRTNMPIIRTGLFVDSDMSYHDLRVAVRSAPATFVVFDSESFLDALTKEDVMEIQEYAVAVWVLCDEDTSDRDVIEIITAGVNGIITRDAANTAAVINKHLGEDAMTRTPIMIGHRGNPSQAPENTMSSFIAAYENGADVFEVDVEITKDGHVIIMHDGTLNRTTTYTGSKTVNQMTLAEVKAEYILGKDGKATEEKVPTLKEVCDYFRDKDCKIFVEFKGSNAQNVPATMKLLDQYGMDYLVDVISFNSNFLTQTQTNSPGMSTGYLVSGQDNGKTPEDALAALYVYLNMAQNANSTINPASGIVQSNGNYFTKAATDRGITVWPWTYIYSSNHIGFMSGCDGVTTDDMQWVTDMAKYLKAPENTTLAVGQQFVGGATVVTYGNTEFTADGSSTVANVICGDDVVKVIDGKLVAIGEGTAEVILGYRSVTPTGGVYVTYTQPFTITVENSKAALGAVIAQAKAAKRTDYVATVYQNILSALEEAQSIYNNANASAEDIANISAILSALVNDTVSKTPVSLGASYTTTTPNRGDGNAYNDDGLRLTDGGKSSADGGSRAYSGWSSGVTVEIVVDLGEIRNTNTYTVYAAAGFWGISAPKSAKVEISTDGESYTTLGTATAEHIDDGGKADGNTVKLYQYRVYADEIQSARYIRFTVTPTGNHTWLDEVEATLTSGIDYMIGDVNSDGEINETDYILIKRACMDTYKLDKEEARAADVNGDGAIDAFDYILIKRHCMGTYKIG